MREIIRAEAWRGIRLVIEELGHDPGPILAAAQVDEAALAEADRYVPLRWMIDSLDMAAQRLKRPDFGLLTGSRASLSELGALTIAANNAMTAREGWEVVGRYIKLHNPALAVMIRPIPQSKRELVAIDYDAPGVHASEQYWERGAAQIHAGLKALCGPQYKPVEVWFRYARISPMSVYRRIFGVEPVFETGAIGVVVERATLDARQPGRNFDLRTLAERYLQSLDIPGDDRLPAKVAGLVRGLLADGECSSGQVARALGLHERTLQRRLIAEQTTFEQIKEGVRREMAEKMLAQPLVPITHIAYALGYADSATFSRSARRWFGMAPRTYRANLLAAPAPAPRNRGSRVAPLQAARLSRRTRVEG